MKNSFIIIGEGPTEYFFLNSLKDEFRSLQNIDPRYPKHTSIKELEQKIKDAIENNYNHIYCMIDLDNKKEKKNKTDYINLKNKYHGKQDHQKSLHKLLLKEMSSLFRRMNWQKSSRFLRG